MDKNEMENEKIVFEELYNRFRPEIYRFLSRMIGSKEAEDLTQDVFIKIATSLGSFKNQSSLSTWIYRIATNAAIDKMRSCSFRNESAASEIIDAGSFQHPLPLRRRVRSTEEELIRNEADDCIRACIEKLPEQYRTILVLSDREGMPNSEISKITGTSIPALKSRLHRGRLLFKEMVAEHCTLYRSECCGSLACTPKERSITETKPVPDH